MGIDRGHLDQLRHALRPLATRVANSIARAVVQLADDSTKLQLLQLGVLAGETVDDAEHHQPFGFSSVPLAGAEAVVVFPNGDRGHPLVIATSDRRYRPTGGEPGTVQLYNHVTARLILLPDGTIEARSKSGMAQSLATKDDVQRLANFVQGLLVGGSGSVVVPAGTVPQPAGTTVLKAE